MDFFVVTVCGVANQGSKMERYSVFWRKVEQAVKIDVFTPDSFWRKVEQAVKIDVFTPDPMDGAFL